MYETVAALSAVPEVRPLGSFERTQAEIVTAEACGPLLTGHTQAERDIYDVALMEAQNLFCFDPLTDTDQAVRAMTHRWAASAVNESRTQAAGWQEEAEPAAKVPASQWPKEQVEALGMQLDPSSTEWGTPEQECAYQLLVMDGQNTNFFDLPPVSKHPLAQELIKNDGLRTYLVLSTNPATARAMFDSGVRGWTRDNRPSFGNVTYMLEAPDSRRGQEDMNTVFLDYRHVRTGEIDANDSTPSTAKVVIELPFGRPVEDVSEGHMHFPHSFSKYLTTWGLFIERDKNDRFASVLLPQYVKGYFDHITGEFIDNPHFIPVSDAEVAENTATEATRVKEAERLSVRKLAAAGLGYLARLLTSK